MTNKLFAVFIVFLVFRFAKVSLPVIRIDFKIDQLSEKNVNFHKEAFDITKKKSKKKKIFFKKIR